MTNDDMMVKARERYGIDDDDNIVASGEDLDWLIRQLAQWPTRVDERYTTNMRFLMQSAALTLASLSPSIPSDTGHPTVKESLTVEGECACAFDHCPVCDKPLPVASIPSDTGSGAV